jgi:hypothetical protein
MRTRADWQAELDARRARRDAAPEGWLRDLLDEVVVAGEQAQFPPPARSEPVVIDVDLEEQREIGLHLWRQGLLDVPLAPRRRR